VLVPSLGLTPSGLALRFAPGETVLRSGGTRPPFARDDFFTSSEAFRSRKTRNIVNPRGSHARLVGEHTGRTPSCERPRIAVRSEHLIEALAGPKSILSNSWSAATVDPSASATITAVAPIISISDLSKTYASGFQALKHINLDIRRAEIFALLGPNGAGKTTLISIICGIVNPSEGAISVDGHDIVAAYRKVRSMIGLVPQELTTDAFETVWATVTFSRGLFGKAANPAYIEKVLKDLSLWDKKDNKILTLSGGMKRRLLIAKALSHEPQILFLDEPTAGVDVELRKDMWQIVRSLRASGVTIILTTHYIEEAEEMADRIGVMAKGELILVERKDDLMRKLGKKQLVLHLHKRLASIPPELAAYGLELNADGSELMYTYDTRAERTGISALMKDISAAGIVFTDLNTTERSLEDIFVDLVRASR
jgi:ABC-2 type transport system ATP-binding protein